LIDALKRDDISNADMTVLWKHCAKEHSAVPLHTMIDSKATISANTYTHSLHVQRMMCEAIDLEPITLSSMEQAVEGNSFEFTWLITKITLRVALAFNDPNVLKNLR
jgi:hypothetical protein